MPHLGLTNGALRNARSFIVILVEGFFVCFLFFEFWLKIFNDFSYFYDYNIIRSDSVPFPYAKASHIFLLMSEATIITSH